MGLHRPMSARPGVGRLGLHQRRRLPSALRGGLDYHPRSVVNWLTRCNVENSSCKPVTCSVGGGLFCCPPGHQRGPDGPLGGLWKLKKFCAHVLFSFRLLATVPAVVRLACCGYMVPRQSKAVKRGTTQSAFCTKSMEPCCVKCTWNHADKSCII